MFVSFLSSAPILLAMATTCPMSPIVSVQVQPVSQEMIINRDKSSAELEKFDISTISPYSHHHATQVNGLMRGEMGVETNVSISWRQDQNSGKACFWYQNIDVTINLAPTVYLAKHLKPKSCLYEQVLEHELKHVNVDRRLSNKYATIFKQNIENFIRQNPQSSPYPAYQVEYVKDQMLKSLDREINRINDQMQQERITAQARIDTLREYQRVADACLGRY